MASQTAPSATRRLCLLALTVLWPELVALRVFSSLGC